MDADVKKLQVLLDVGSLKVITSEHADPKKLCAPQIEQARKAAEVNGATKEELASIACGGSPDPAHYVIHDVTRLEGPNHRGLVTAWTDEGDWCQGTPAALLKRLTETGV